ncbi:MAG: hypothetical protein R2800_15285 [Flavipsychrobacter sp.]
MKKAINIGLLLASLFGYMEWGNNYSNFVYEVEYGLFTSITDKSKSFLHPFILIPLLGQLLLLFTFFQKKPSKVLSIIGMVCLSVIMFFLFFIGFLGPNIKIMLFALPYVLISVLFIWYNRKKKSV